MWSSSVVATTVFVCSAYLAMAGLKVLVLDQRPVAGGAAVTEEFSPGFRNSVASYAVSLLNPKIIRDLNLGTHGLRIVERPISNFLPLNDGGFLKIGGSHTKREVAKFSARDAECLDDYQRRLAAIADVLRASVLETPPNVVEGNPFVVIAELFKAGRIAKRIRALGLDLQRDLLDLFAASAGDFLDGWFESAPIKAAFGFDSVVGNYASPYTAGSAYVLLHHSFGEVNGRKGVWGHAIGGMGAITQAMAKLPPRAAWTSGFRRGCARSLSRMGAPSALRRTRVKPSVPQPLPRGLTPSSSTSTSLMRAPCPTDSGDGWKPGVAGLARFG